MKSCKNLCLGAILSFSMMTAGNSLAATDAPITDPGTSLTTEISQPVIGPVAMVNGVAIKRQIFDKAMEEAMVKFTQIGMQDGNKDQQNTVREKVIERLVNMELLFQEGQRRGLTASEAEMDPIYKSFLKQFETDKEFEDFLAENKTTEKELKDDLQRVLTMEKLHQALRQELTAGIKISDEEIKKFYNDSIDMFSTPEQVKASHILISVNKDANETIQNNARTKLKDLRQQLTDGADFTKLAKANSSCPSSANGGDLGFFDKETMVKPFADAAFSLEKGGVSKIVETQFGYHLIKVTDKKAGQTKRLKEVEEELSTWLKQQKTDQAFTDFIEDLNSKADIVHL